MEAHKFPYILIECMTGWKWDHRASIAAWWFRTRRAGGLNDSESTESPNFHIEKYHGICKVLDWVWGGPVLLTHKIRTCGLMESTKHCARWQFRTHIIARHSQNCVYAATSDTSKRARPAHADTKCKRDPKKHFEHSKRHARWTRTPAPQWAASIWR